MSTGIHLYMPYPRLGDQICFQSAARIYARVFPDKTVSVSAPRDIVRLYKDDLLSRPHVGHYTGWKVLPAPWQRMKRHEGNNNYVGTFLREMGIQTPPVCPELPAVDPVDGLEPGSYVAFQPKANWAKNPPPAFINQILHVVQHRYRIVLAGGPETRDAYPVCDPNYLGDAINMLRVIRHARFVLTPRSASAHIAAAYRKPCLVWLPSDGENWHLDYPGWDHIRILFEATEAEIDAKLVKLEKAL